GCSAPAPCGPRATSARPRRAAPCRRTRRRPPCTSPRASPGRSRAPARGRGRGAQPRAASLVLEAKARPWPFGGEQPPGTGGRDVRGAELAAAEAEVGGERVARRHL